MSPSESRIPEALAVAAVALLLIGAVMVTTSTLGRAPASSAAVEPPGEIEEGALTSDSSDLETTSEANSAAASGVGYYVTPVQPIAIVHSSGEGEPEVTTVFEDP